MYEYTFVNKTRIVHKGNAESLTDVLKHLSAQYNKDFKVIMEAKQMAFVSNTEISYGVTWKEV